MRSATERPEHHVARVRAYYERNTRLFLRSGTGRRTHTIHRAVWAPGVASPAQALMYINTLVRDAVASYAAGRGAPSLRVLDLGCGVGGVLCDLVGSAIHQLRGVGVSISPTQIRIARAHAVALGLAERCTFMEANYLSLPFGPAFDVAFAIESLVHAPDLSRALGEAARALLPGGRLLICDDFLRAGAPRGTGGADPVLLEAAFRRGWHAPALTTVAGLVERAARFGLDLVEQRDLTPDLRLLRLPSPAVAATLRAGLRVSAGWSFTQSLVGGLALQHGLGQGIFGYHWLAFEKRATFEQRGPGRACPP
jgi:ubiquinone/menaquinone biosynthesis C-methylase UbiE